MSETYDTDWALSNKGNQWRRLHGRLLVVGQSKYGFWARVGDSFVKGRFSDTAEAKSAAERAVATVLTPPDFGPKDWEAQ
jgi:hypothetical protein